MSGAESLIGKLDALFREKFHVEVPSADTDLLESGILDSFQLVELLLELERQYGFRVRIDDVEIDDLRTLARIARLVSAGDGAGASACAAS